MSDPKTPPGAPRTAKSPSAGPEALRTALAAAGVALMAAGAWMAWPPAGLMLGGAIVLGLAVAGTVRASR